MFFIQYFILITTLTYLILFAQSYIYLCLHYYDLNTRSWCFCLRNSSSDNQNKNLGCSSSINSSIRNGDKREKKFYDQCQ